ncbi:hypothetical protein PR202_ga22839 [Eleusine coracana subsp. coracana]|uniref:Uncharacterized protein n=1 Tax=Eleusine coracana subsp. coracana TaxID=191504 RepID=A0AAV5D4Z3_ELECO|nr:hypothetical protein PR202_ga22839 [Eleusine coracana subsp. coracana]
MIYTAIDTFYLTDEQLRDSPSRKDGIDEATETALRVYGCDLIQESGILLRLYPFSIVLLAPHHLFLLYLQIQSVGFSQWS